MRVHEQRKVEVVKKTLVKITCNQCQSIIKSSQKFYEVTTGHKDWGNDSVDSIEHFDICSDACLQKQMNEYMQATNREKYIEIQQAEVDYED